MIYDHEITMINPLRMIRQRQEYPTRYVRAGSLRSDIETRAGLYYIKNDCINKEKRYRPKLGNGGIETNDGALNKALTPVYKVPAGK